MLLRWLEIEGREGGGIEGNKGLKVDQGAGAIEGDEGNDDVELQSIQPSKSLLWMSYRDWLKLIVAHMDAVAILSTHVCGNTFPYTGISIEIIPPQPVSSTLLSWKTLLQSRHFLKANNLEDLIQFFDGWLKKMTLAEDTAKALWSVMSLQEARSICNAIRLLHQKDWEDDGNIVPIAEMVQPLADSGPGPLTPDHMNVANRVTGLLNNIKLPKKLVKNTAKALHDILHSQEAHSNSKFIANSICDAILLLLQKEWEYDCDIVPITRMVQPLADSEDRPLMTNRLNIANQVATLLNNVKLPNIMLFNKLREMEQGLGFLGVVHCELQVGVLIALGPSSGLEFTELLNMHCVFFGSLSSF